MDRRNPTNTAMEIGAGLLCLISAYLKAKMRKLFPPLMILTIVIIAVAMFNAKTETATRYVSFFALSLLPTVLPDLRLIDHFEQFRCRLRSRTR